MVSIYRFSPRRVLLTAMAIQATAGTTVALAPQFEIQVFLRFLTALATVIMFTTAYMICRCHERQSSRSFGQTLPNFNIILPQRKRHRRDFSFVFPRRNYVSMSFVILPLLLFRARHQLASAHRRHCLLVHNIM